MANTSRRAERRLRLGERVGARRDTDRLVRIEGLDELPAQLGRIVVDDGDRDGAHELAEIGLRIERRRR